MQKEPHISSSPVYQYVDLRIPLTLTEGYLAISAKEMRMEPAELLARLRREWRVEVIPDTHHAEL